MIDDYFCHETKYILSILSTSNTLWTKAVAINMHKKYILDL